MISLIPIDAIEEGKSKGIDLDNAYLFAVKKDNEIYLYFNRCPHIGTPLEWEEDQFLDEDGALIRCSTHGALFQIEDGHCLAGPCKGKYLQRIPYRIIDGQISVAEEDLKLPPLL